MNVTDAVVRVTGVPSVTPLDELVVTPHAALETIIHVASVS
jgi:hypothetical protein